MSMIARLEANLKATIEAKKSPRERCLEKMADAIAFWDDGISESGAHNAAKHALDAAIASGYVVIAEEK
jgi:hypothetical protein